MFAYDNLVQWCKDMRSAQIARRIATRHDAPSHHARPNRRRVANVVRLPAWNCLALSEWSTMALIQVRSKGHEFERIKDEARSNAT